MFFNDALTPDEQRVATEDPSGWKPEERAAYYRLHRKKIQVLYFIGFMLATFFIFDIYFTRQFFVTQDHKNLWLGVAHAILFFGTLFVIFVPALKRHRLSRNPKMHID